jgi:hypothetical protein
VALLAKAGHFEASSGAVGTQQPITGVGFQPKCVFFWWVRQFGSANNFGGNHLCAGFGFAENSVDRWAVANQSENASATSDTDRAHRRDACVAFIGTGGAIDALLDFVSMDVDGFTLVVDDAFSSASFAIQYLALGGDDLTDVASGQFNEPAAIGNQAITGTGFLPDFVLFGSIALDTAPPAVTTISNLMLGMASGPDNEGVWASEARHGQAAASTRSYRYNGECIACQSAGSTVARAEFVSFDANGFTLNWLERSSTRAIFYVAFKGGKYRVGNFLTSLTAGATIPQSGFGFSPKGTLLFSMGRPESGQDAPNVHGRLNIGAFTSPTNRFSSGYLDEDAADPTDCEEYIRIDRCLGNISTTPALVGLVDVQTIDSDGFTLVMDTADIEAASVLYVAFGDAAQSLLVDQVVETSAAQSISRFKSREVVQAVESELPTVVVRLKSLQVGQSFEEDAATAMSKLKSLVVSQTVETDLAQGAAKLKLRGIGQVTETELAQVVVRVKTLSSGQVSETDLAQAIAGLGGSPIGQVIEIDLVQVVARLKTLLVSQSSESDLAQVAARLKTLSVGQSLESDLVQLLIRGKMRGLAQALEVSLAQEIARLKALLLIQVIETDLAQIIEVDLGQHLISPLFVEILQGAGKIDVGSPPSIVVGESRERVEIP